MINSLEIDTTNTIEVFHRQVRKVTKTKGLAFRYGVIKFDKPLRLNCFAVFIYCRSRIAHLVREYKEHQSVLKVGNCDQTRHFKEPLKILIFIRLTHLITVEKRQERDLVDQVFSTRSFVRTLSYREFVTSLSLALLLLAIYSILDYYSNEDWIENNESLIKWTLFCILLPINHILYKVEHKRPNNFIGRNLHDYIFLLLFVSLYKLRLFLYGSSFSFGIDGIGSVIIFLLVFIIMVMLFELVGAILKRGFKLLRWQIL